MRYLFLFLIIACAQASELALVREVHAVIQYQSDGVVEAVRQSVIAPQVSGQLLAIAVRAGERVQKGQLLARIDGTAARQTATAMAAQVSAARAQLEVAQKELVRQQQLFAQRFISQAALDQAQAQYQATEASVNGTLAQSAAAQTQTGFYTLGAPFAGVVAEVNAEVGEMAMPGKALMILYEPTALRVLANLPQASLAKLEPAAAIRVELPALAADERIQTATGFTILPAASVASHSVPIRIDLPAGVPALPGMFARVTLPLADEGASRLYVPQSAIIRRAELNAVYVRGEDGRSLLRQVRLGRVAGEDIEVLAGLRVGEQVLINPARAH